MTWKRANLKLFTLLLLVSIVPPAKAQFSYATNSDGTLDIIGYTDTNPVVTIPSMDLGLPVTTIDSYVFEGKSFITSVTIPESIVAIGIQAFYQCGSLTNIVIPDSVRYLGSETFGLCYNLTSVTFGNGITNIPYYGFELCTNLNNVSLGTNISVIGYRAFSYCGFTNFVIPSTVNFISSYAFAGTKLYKIIIPASVTVLTNYVFASEPNLETVIIPASVTNIYGYAFYNSPNLSGVFFLGNRPLTASAYAFFDDNAAIAYYLLGTTGWTNSSFPIGVVPWNPTIVTTNSNFGVQNDQFGFDVLCVNGSFPHTTYPVPIIVQAATDLSQSNWQSVYVGKITVNPIGGISHFTDPAWTNYPSRFYRITSP